MLVFNSSYSFSVTNNSKKLYDGEDVGKQKRQPPIM